MSRSTSSAPMTVEITRQGEWPGEALAFVTAVTRPHRPRWDGSRGFQAGKLTYRYRDGGHADDALRASLNVDCPDGAALREWRQALAGASVRPCPPHRWIEYFVPRIGNLQLGGHEGLQCEKCGVRR